MSTEVIQPYEWQRPIIERQVASLKAHGFFLNACFMGAGKTVLALQTVKELGAPALVVAPLVSHEQWRDTAEKMGVTTLVDVINIEKVSASKNCRWYTPERKWHDGENPFPRGMLVILDECHHGCSGVDSKATKAFAILKAYRGTMLLAMSATPMVSPLQGRMLGFWAGLHNFHERSFYDWCNRNGCGMVEIGWGRRKRAIYRFTVKIDEARAYMQRIRESMGDMFTAVGPKDIPGFPDETIDIMRLKVDAKDEAKLAELRKKMPERYYDFGKSDEEGEPDDRMVSLRLRQQAEFLKSWWMADEAIAHVTNGKSVVVFLNFSEPRFVIEERMREAGIPFMSIYGGQSQDERNEAIRRFQENEAYVAVCMMQAAGCAVSLHDKLHERMRVALISPGFDASQVVQALGRTRRVGGTNAHQVFCLYTGTEDRTYRSLKNKVGCLESLTDGDLKL